MPEEAIVQRPLRQIRYIVEGFYDIQQLRIAAQLQIGQLERNGLSADVLRELVFARLKADEKEIEKSITAYVKALDVWQTWLKGVKGIGPIITAGLESWVDDIGRFDNVAKLWAYAGLHVIDGAAARRKKGEKANWNSRLKTLCWKIGESFVKTKGGYRGEYDKAKAYYQQVHSDYTKGHIHAMAKRKAVKLFLSHYWHVKRELAGLSTQAPYAIAKLGHTTYIEPYQE